MIEDDNIIVLKPEVIEVKYTSDFELELIPENEQNKGSIQNAQSCYANEIENMNEIICEHYHIKIDII